MPWGRRAGNRFRRWFSRRRSRRSELHRRFQVRLGLRLPQRLGVDLQHDLVEAARTAEAAGYASLWTYEQLLFPETPAEPYAPPNVPWPESGRQTADPLAVLTAAAVATEEVRLGTAVLIAALHTPVQL